MNFIGIMCSPKFEGKTHKDGAALGGKSVMPMAYIAC